MGGVEMINHTADKVRRSYLEDAGGWRQEYHLFY